MAGDWIKISSNLADKPEVVRMAFLLKIDRDFVAGKLARLWSWADQHSVDGNGITVTCDFIDELVRKRGFARAMADVGWLTGEDNSLNLPNFDRHNGETAKARAVTNRRVAKHRNQSESSGHDEENGNADTVTNVTPIANKKRYQRREEKRDIATSGVTSTSSSPVDNSSKPHGDKSPWTKTDQGIVDEAAREGLTPRPGESFFDLKQRVFEVKSKRLRGEPV
jgi:hypothetical protein